MLCRMCIPVLFAILGLQLQQQPIGNLYGPSGAAAVAAQSNIYTGNIPAVSGTKCKLERPQIVCSSYNYMYNVYYVTVYV